ncbi:MAG: hypothetical protein ABIO70_15970 [Pseudomonadota bacterium]
MTTRPERSYPVEEFVQALIHQLDNVQDALALKVRTGRPLTWALKDLSLDLRVFVDVDARGIVTLRSAGPNEEGASTVHLALTTITRPMIEENTYSFSSDEDPRSLDDIGPGAGLTDEQKRRLSYLGVRTVGQLKRMSDPGTQQAIQAQAGIPVNDLMAALQASARATIAGHTVSRDREGQPLVRIMGANLYDGVTPEVRLDGDAVEVLEARSQELVVRPRSSHREGQVEVFVSGQRATGFFRLPERQQVEAPAGEPEPAWTRDPYGGPGREGERS